MDNELPNVWSMCIKNARQWSSDPFSYIFKEIFIKEALEENVLTLPSVWAMTRVPVFPTGGDKEIILWRKASHIFLCSFTASDCFVKKTLSHHPSHVCLHSVRTVRRGVFPGCGSLLSNSRGRPRGGCLTLWPAEALYSATNTIHTRSYAGSH